MKTRILITLIVGLIIGSVGAWAVVNNPWYMSNWARDAANVTHWEYIRQDGRKIFCSNTLEHNQNGYIVATALSCVVEP